MDFLSLIFPKYCINCKRIGSYLCDNCFSFLSFDTQGICVVCNRPSINSLTHPRCATRYTIDGIFSSISYKGVAKKLVYQFKYKPYLSNLNNLLIDLFFEGLIQKEEFYNIIKNLKSDSVLIPIPLHSSRLKSRGYNQAEILAKGLSKKMNLKILNCLKRTKKTSSQAALKREERTENIKGAFSIIQNLELKIQNAFLVDDIFTTGSTLNEASKILKRKGVEKVWGLTLARD